MVLAAGCLDTKEAWPAVVDGSVLKDEGWVSAGDVQKHSQTQNVAGANVKINMALMNYRDEVLAQNITGQVRKLSGITSKQASGATQFTSQLITTRLLLPAWPESGSNIIVFAVLPAEDIVITPSTGKPVSVKINGEKESQKIIRLIQNVS